MPETYFYKSPVGISGFGRTRGATHDDEQLGSYHSP